MRLFVKRSHSPISGADSDNDSARSTRSMIPVVQLKPKTAHPSILKASVRTGYGKPKSCRVTFDESRNMYCKATANPKHLRACWYDAEDYASFKASSAVIARETLRSDSKANVSYRRVIAAAVSRCSGATAEAEDYSRHTSILSEKDELDLRKSISNSNSRFGLEHLTVPALSEELSARRLEARRALFDIQNTTPRGQGQARMLRNALETVSRSNRLFALEKGRALAAGLSV